ncbi:MAG: hypothetical protein AB8G26_10595 [Ilumatobacter sp.]
MLAEIDRLLFSSQVPIRNHAMTSPTMFDDTVSVAIAEGGVPEIPPSDLEGAIARTPGGDDWVLLRAHLRRLDDFVAWRQTWESPFGLGRLSQLRAFQRAATAAGLADDPDAALLDRLTRSAPSGAPAHFDTDELDRLIGVVDRVLGTIRSAHGLGTALVDSSPTIQRTGLLRSWSSTERRAVLARRRHIAVHLDDGRIDVVDLESDEAIVFDVVSFEVGVHGATVTDGEGREHVLDDVATDALCAVAPEASGWRVRVVPEVLVFAELKAGLEVAADASSFASAPARVHVRDLDQSVLGPTL